MNTRQTNRNVTYSHILNGTPLSDTEDMDDDYDEDGEESDSQEILFLPQSRRRPPLNRIQDTEDYVSETDVDTTDVSDEEGRVAEDEPRHQPRYYRIYFPDAEEPPSENEAGGDNADGGVRENDSEVGEARILSDDSNSASSVEGRFSPDNDEPMVQDDDVDDDAHFRVFANVEEVSHRFMPIGGENQSHPVPTAASSSHQDSHGGEMPVSPGIDGEGSRSPRTGGDADSIQKPSTSKEGLNPDTLPAASSSGVGDNEDDGQMCTICFEPWSNCGDHRIVSLKCGHLFGKICIEKWLKGGSKCPQCNAKANKKDIRVIYAKCLKVEDTTEKERLAKEIKKLNRIKAQFEREKAQQKVKIDLDSQLIKKLQLELRMLKESVKNNSSGDSLPNVGASNSKEYKLTIFQTFEVIKRGNCRVMAFSEWMSMLVVSIPSQLEMFPGFGVKKINTVNLKAGNYVPLHSKQIRDLAFNQSRQDLLLSVSLDKTAKITNVSSCATVVSYTTTFPLWACCWNSDRSTEFFAGTSAGTILHFDTVLATTEPIHSYEISGSGPVVSISYIPSAGDKDFYLSGLIVTRLSSISFIEFLGGEIKEHGIPIEGPFTHTVFDPISRHFLTTCRPNNRNPHARHVLCELKMVEAGSVKVVSAHEVYCFDGSTTMKVLSRACLVSKPNNNDVSAAIFSEESTNSVKVYDISTSSLKQTLNQGTNAVDILPVNSCGKNYIAMLSDKYVKFYQWIEQLKI